MHLLLIEDDLDLGSSLQQALRQAGWSSEWLRSAEQARQFAAQAHHDCVLLDLTLPDGHGLELLRSWRAQGMATPLIVITASDALGDRLAGLDEGADDFLVKPFAVEELISRVRAVTRRMARQASAVWQFGSLAIDPARRECRLGDQPVSLSPREFEILSVLARAAGSVVPKHRLAQALQPLGDAVDFNAIEVHVHNLRRKVGAERVRTVRGVGYQLHEGPERPERPEGHEAKP
jgi:DNA-binding response OmpR family regulator